MLITTLVNLWLLLFLAIPGHGHKILMFPLPGDSHVFSLYHISRELIRRGDEVHFLLHWSFTAPSSWADEERKMILHRYGKNSGYDVKEATKRAMLDFLSNEEGIGSTTRHLKDFNRLFLEELFFSNDTLFDHLQTLNFDVSVVDTIFFMKFPLLVPHRLNIPVITYTDQIEPWVVRTPWIPSIFSPFDPSADGSSNFVGRFTNFLTAVMFYLFPPIADPDETLLNEYRKYGNFKNLDELMSRSILFFTTEDPVLSAVRPYTANMIQIGGLSTESLLSTPASLPKEYLDFIENDLNVSSDTVVVSFGSQMKIFPENLAKIFLKAFELLPQYRFIWRFENQKNLHIPENVKIVNWIPQRELLGHPSVKLFVTHSGNNGQFEAIYHGVPMLAIPVFGDQPKNARRIVDKGYGEEANFRSITIKTLVILMQKVIEDQSYKVRVMKASKIFKSRPNTPAQRAAFWIDHVVRFGGDHLKPAGKDLYLLQYLCLDVLLSVQLSILIISIITILAIRKVFDKVRRYLSRSPLTNTTRKSMLNKKRK